jgi:hypothetical protein
MPDNKELRNKQDRGRVSENENYELAYLEEKMGVSRDEVKAAIQEVGNERLKVEEYLEKNQRKGSR